MKTRQTSLTGQTRKGWQRLLASAGVGVAATIADLLALVCLVELVGLGPQHANVPALIVGIAIQFVGNKYLAFGDRSALTMRQGGAFLLVEAGALSLNAVLFHIAVSFTAMPYILARVLVSAAVYLGFSYPLWGRVFRPDIESRSDKSRSDRHRTAERTYA